MDALLPLASLPVQISGRNRVWRRTISDAIRSDPEWHNGDYARQPPSLRTAEEIYFFMGSSPLLRWQQMPDRSTSDAVLDAAVAADLKTDDANDTLYQIEASTTTILDGLESIRAPLLAINSADDLINPRNLAILEREIKRVKYGRAVLIRWGGNARARHPYDGRGVEAAADSAVA